MRVVERRKEGKAMLHGGMGKRSREGLLGKLSKHSSNENVPKSKSVELSKIYNFALRFSFKRVKNWNLF
jgi:hypothetical protein